MIACEHCCREFKGRGGPFPECPYCQWRQGSALYFLDRDPTAEVEHQSMDKDRVFDYSRRARAEYK
jgi:hypothetical protein